VGAGGGYFALYVWLMGLHSLTTCPAAYRATLAA